MARQRRLLRRPGFLAPILVIAALVVLGLFGDVIAPHDPGRLFPVRGAGPSADHWFGTDGLGRDVLSRIIGGAGVTVEAIVRALVLAIVLGVPVGLVAGYRGGWFDRVSTLLVEILFSIPGLVLALSIIAVLGVGLESAMIAVGIGMATRYARLTRGLVLAAREEQYVDAARIAGASTTSILGRQILPNIAGPLIVQTAIYAGTVVLIEAALSFIGVGLPVNEASWGGMLNQARGDLFRYPWLPLAPAATLSVTVLAFNMVGDAARDALGRAEIRHHLDALRDRTTPASPLRDEPSTDAALAVTDLEVVLRGESTGAVTIVDGVSLAVRRGETLGLVGESGCGKSTTALAVMGLLPVGLTMSRGRIDLGRRDDQNAVELSALDRSSLQRHLGRDMAMIFQDPSSALNPSLTIGAQIAEPMIVHGTATVKQAHRRAVDLLAEVGIPDPYRRAGDYPHMLSGGMAQRAMIAMALANEPSVLIADEPTTALDVTMQAEIADLLGRIQADHGLALLLITHDLGLAAEMCDRIAVMYAGQIVEASSADAVLNRPVHPYTRALVRSMPGVANSGERLAAIAGAVPSPGAWPVGCRFAPRCAQRQDCCDTTEVALEVTDDRDLRCVRANELAESGVVR